MMINYSFLSLRVNMNWWKWLPLQKNKQFRTLSIKSYLFIIFSLLATQKHVAKIPLFLKGNMKRQYQVNSKKFFQFFCRDMRNISFFCFWYTLKLGAPRQCRLRVALWDSERNTIKKQEIRGINKRGNTRFIST